MDEIEDTEPDILGALSAHWNVTDITKLKKALSTQQFKDGAIVGWRIVPTAQLYQRHMAFQGAVSHVASSVGTKQNGPKPKATLANEALKRDLRLMLRLANEEQFQKDTRSKFDWKESIAEELEARFDLDLDPFSLWWRYAPGAEMGERKVRLLDAEVASGMEIMLNFQTTVLKREASAYQLAARNSVSASAGAGWTAWPQRLCNKIEEILTRCLTAKKLLGECPTSNGDKHGRILEEEISIEKAEEIRQQFLQDSDFDTEMVREDLIAFAYHLLREAFRKKTLALEAVIVEIGPSTISSANDLTATSNVSVSSITKPDGSEIEIVGGGVTESARIDNAQAENTRPLTSTTSSTSRTTSRATRAQPKTISQANANQTTMKRTKVVKRQQPASVSQPRAALPTSQSLETVEHTESRVSLNVLLCIQQN